jgi:acyl-CoA synthetase (AMP-forming)/AMP-acid ligase II/aryl carrier-like protein
MVGNSHLNDNPISKLLCISDFIRDSSSRWPDAAALGSPGRRSLSYRGLASQVDCLATHLAALGVRTDDRVAVVLENGPEMAAVFLGVAAIAACAPLNPAYGAREFEYYLSDLGARALVVLAGADSPAVKAARACGIEVIEVRPNLEAEAGRLILEGDRLESAKPPRLAGADAIALVLHTSGTTSRPKIVPLTHANICASAHNVRETLGLATEDRCLNVMPLFHIHGLVAALLASLFAGSSVVCTPGFWAPDFFGWIEQCRPTWYTAVPTMHQAILARADGNREIIKRYPLRFLRSSSAALPPQVMAELERVFQAPVIEAYGMTEAAHQIASNPLPPRPRRPGSVGLAAGPTIAIMNDGGHLLRAGQVGEIVICGSNVTTGYENNVEANQQAFVGEWFRTGDEGSLDEDGYLIITGRLKEIINRGGEKISPREVDLVLLDHPAVAQAVTFAIPHPSLGEEVAAALVLRPGASATEDEIREFVAQRLAYFKVPARVLFLDEIPKGPTGKLQRIRLAETLGQVGGTPSCPATETQVKPPTGDVETILARIWADVLRLERVGVDQNFLVLGGDSILATRIVARVADRFHVDLSLVSLFSSPTVAGMAEVIERALARSSAEVEDRLGRLLSELEGLSDDEAAQILADELHGTS